MNSVATTASPRLKFCFPIPLAQTIPSVCQDVLQQDAWGLPKPLGSAHVAPNDSNKSSCQLPSGEKDSLPTWLW